MDVLLQRRRVAVVELHPPRLRRELVRELAAGRDDLEDAVHVRGMDAVEVDRVRVRALVAKVHAQEVVLGRADHGTGRRAVVRPRRRSARPARPRSRRRARRASYSRSRPGCAAARGGGTSSASTAGSRAIEGASFPIIAAWPSGACTWSWPSCVAERSVSANATRAQRAGGQQGHGSPKKALPAEFRHD